MKEFRGLGILYSYLIPRYIENYTMIAIPFLLGPFFGIASIRHEIPLGLSGQMPGLPCKDEIRFYLTHIAESPVELTISKGSITYTHRCHNLAQWSRCTGCPFSISSSICPFVSAKQAGVRGWLGETKAGCSPSAQ